MTDTKKTPIAAHILVGLVTLGLSASAAAKLSGAQAIVENFEKLHLTPFRVPIGIIEIVSVVLFAVPKTSSLGTLLLTGYLGGAVVAHLTSNDAAGMGPALVLGLLAWTANYLRNRQMFESLTRSG
jgi:DoxX-like family